MNARMQARLDWIDSHLATGGTINRPLLMRQFSISNSTAYATQKAFRNSNRKPIRYDESRKVYVPIQEASA